MTNPRIARTLTGALLSGIALTVTPNTATGACSTGYCQAHVSRMHTEYTVPTIQGDITQMERDIENAIGKQTNDQGKFFQTLAKSQTRMQTQRMLQARNQAINAKRLELAQAIEGNQQACQYATGSLEGSATAAYSRTQRQQLATRTQSWFSGTNNAASMEGNDTADAARAGVSAGSFCDAADVRAGACDPEDAQEARQKGVAGADANISKSLFSGPNLKDEKAKAASMYILNLMSPEVLGRADASTSPQQMADRNNLSAEMSSGVEAMGYMWSVKNTAVQDRPNSSGKTPGAFALDMAKTIPHLNPANYQDGTSLNGWWKARANGWTNNPNWISQIKNETDNTKLLKQLNYMLAFQIWQDWRRHQLERRKVAVQSALLSAQLEKDIEDFREVAANPGQS